MSSASDYLENLALDAILGSGHATAMPATVYVALLTDASTDDTLGTEVSGGSYARASVTNNDTNWPDAVSGEKSNGTQITFPTLTATWGTITHWAIMDASSGGNMLFYGSLSSSITPIVGNAPFFPVGTLVITAD